MSQLQNILVVVDPNMQTTPALRRGVELARGRGAQLHLCLFAHDVFIERAADLVHPDVMNLAKRQFLQERLNWLNQQAGVWAEQKLKVSCDAVWAPVLPEAMLAKTLELAADLVIKDVQRESPLQRLLVTPADWKVLRYSPVPLMLVSPDSNRPPRCILAAVDTTNGTDKSALNKAILDAAQLLARDADAEVHVAHAFPYTPLYSAPYRKLENVYAQVKHDDWQAFTDFAVAHDIPQDRRHLVDGEPAPTLARLGRRLGADLIVLGSLHHSAVERLFLGSTAEGLLSQANCDVLLVKPPEFLEELSRHLDLDGLRQRYRTGTDARHASWDEVANA